jgi:hypothetical protein
MASESSSYRVKGIRYATSLGTKQKTGAEITSVIVATAPTHVWTWDITLLNGPVKGLFYRLYLTIDLARRFGKQRTLYMGKNYTRKHRTEKFPYHVKIIETVINVQPSIKRNLLTMYQGELLKINPNRIKNSKPIILSELPEPELVDKSLEKCFL